MAAGPVPTGPIQSLYNNTTAGTVADPGIMDGAFQAVVQTVNDNWQEFFNVINALVLPIPDQSIVTRHLRNLAVTNEKLAPFAVTADKIADGTINTQKLADAVVTAIKIANGNVTNPKLADGAVDSRVIANSAIQSRHIDPGLLLPYTSIAVQQSFDKRGVDVTDGRFGAKGDGIADDTNAILAAMNYIGNSGAVYFPRGTYRVTSTITFPTNSYKIKLFSDANAVIKVDHNGDGFVLNALNENYSGHVLEGLAIQGPNASYPASGYTPPSSGAGIRMNVAYYCVIRDCSIYGFQYGVYLKTGIKNVFEGSTYIRFNQYGVFIDGGATNVNNFTGIAIRENRKCGVYFNNGVSPYPSHNVFMGCLIESNIPYPTVSGGNAPNDSIGVWLANAYYNIFDSCYFENHQYAVYITASSDGNKFTRCRFSPFSDNSRTDRIMFDGAGVNNNTFTGCQHMNVNSTTPSVESNNTNQLYNQFIDCEGFNFINANILAIIDIINHRPNQGGNGTPFGALLVPQHGIYNNPGEGTGRRQISGIGTANAVLNADGFGEIMLGSLITAATTITSITGLRKGQYFLLGNYQIAHPVTIKSSTDGINGIVLRNGRDAVLSGYSDVIMFYVTQQGKVVEVGRNFKEEVIAAVTSKPSFLGQIAIVGGVAYIGTGTNSAADWKQITN